MQVKATKEIWNDIHNNIKRLFVEREAYAENWYNYGLTKQQFDAICEAELLSPEEIEMIEKLGERFFSRHTAVSVLIPIEDRSQPARYNLTFSNGPRLIPDKWDDYSNGQQTIKNSELSAIATRRQSKCAALKTEREQLVETAKSFYNSVPSINRFVKLWPAGRDLLDAQTIAKLNKKVSVERADTPEIDVAALQQLNTSMLKARVAA